MNESTGLENAQLRLNNLENSRKTFARLIREYAKGNIPRTVFRDLCYALVGFLSFLKTEKELDIEERISALEELLERSGTSR